jgi:methionine sulfoxide reductase heme-binding subunit
MNTRVMLFLITYIRYFVLGGACLVALVAAGYYLPRFSNGYPGLVRFYGLTAIAFLYVALLATPLTLALPTFPLRAIYIKARRAIGVSAFFFGLLHGSIAFFILLGGFPGLPYLPNRYLLAISFSATGLVILSLLTATSFDAAVRYLGTRWKPLHRFVYLAGTLILFHALLLGTHLSNLANPIGQIFFVAVLFLISLQLLRIARVGIRRFPRMSPQGWYAASLVLLLLIVWSLWYFISVFGPKFH